VSRRFVNSFDSATVFVIVVTSYNLSIRNVAIHSVSRSLSKNYDPHIKPSALTAPETQELRKTLISNAKAMLQKFLTKDRVNRTWGHRVLNNTDKKILKVCKACIGRIKQSICNLNAGKFD
jgi:hypothetical protein